VTRKRYSSPRPDEAPSPARTGFRPEFLDFRRGIHVGNLDENQRITRILKLAVEARYGQPFVTERYGRGVYWRWIGLLARANRAAKPVSSAVSFGCAKLFISLDPEDALFKCGLQVERGFLKAPRGSGEWRLQSDWDWNRLVAALKPSSPLDRELRRLLDDGFQIFAGGWGEGGEPFSRDDYPGARKLRAVLERAPANFWAGFQLYYPMTEADVNASSGPDLVDSMLAVFDEVVPVLNICSDVQIKPVRG
jgi:hypothetical protein